MIAYIGLTAAMVALNKVTGDVMHKSLTIEEGAQLEGMCKRLQAPAAAQVVLPAPSALAPLANGDTKPLADRLAAIS